MSRGISPSFTNAKAAAPDTAKVATWDYAYDAAGRLVEEQSPYVSLTTVTQVGGNLVEGTSEPPVRIVTRTEYDALGNVVSRTEAQGRLEQRITTYQYDALGRQVKTIYPSTPVYVRETDAALAANGAPAPATRTDREPTVPHSSEVFYDVFGDAVASTDANSNTSYKAYDALGRVAYEIDALAYVTGYERNVYGDATAVTRYAEKPVLSASPTAAPTAQEIGAALGALPAAAQFVSLELCNSKTRGG